MDKLKLLEQLTNVLMGLLPSEKYHEITIPNMTREELDELYPQVKHYIICKLLEAKYKQMVRLESHECCLYRLEGFGHTKEVKTLEQILDMIRNMEWETEPYLIELAKTGKIIGFEKLHPELPYYYR